MLEVRDGVRSGIVPTLHGIIYDVQHELDNICEVIIGSLSLINIDNTKK